MGDRQTSQPVSASSSVIEGSLDGSVSKLVFPCEPLSVAVPSRTPTPARNSATAPPTCPQSQLYKPLVVARPCTDRPAKPLVTPATSETLTNGKSRHATPSGAPSSLIRSPEKNTPSVHAPAAAAGLITPLVPAELRGRWRWQETRQAARDAQKHPIRVLAPSSVVGKDLDARDVSPAFSERLHGEIIFSPAEGRSAGSHTIRRH